MKQEYLEVVDKLEKELQEEVNPPNHYTQGKYEPIEVIADWQLNFNLGNVIKYIARCEMYLNHEIERLASCD